MGVVKFLAWTVVAVALGIWLASGRVGDRSPLQHAEAALKSPGTRGISQLTRPVREALEDVHDTVTHDPKAPRERHSTDDRKALDSLISKRGGQAAPAR
jgi:hypothetical protein